MTVASTEVGSMPADQPNRAAQMAHPTGSTDTHVKAQS